MESIYFMGPDGSGKTSFLKDVESVYLSLGKLTQYIWLRSPKILSKPLMAYCRLIGLTKYTIIDGVKYGKHEFYRSKFVSWLFPILQLIDFKFKWFLTPKKIDSILLFDRFSLDTLADLMVDTHRFNLHQKWFGKAFIKLIPKNTNMILLDVHEENIRLRKKDTLYDEHLQNKIKVYNILSKDLNIKVIDNNRDYNIVKEEILDYLFNERN